MSKISHNRQGGNNFSCRVTVLIFTILAIGCAVCANIFPVFKKESNTKKIKQTLWYSQTTVPGGVGTKVDVSDSLCGQYKLFFSGIRGCGCGCGRHWPRRSGTCYRPAHSGRKELPLHLLRSLTDFPCVRRLRSMRGAYCVWVHEGLLPERRRAILAVRSP
ncbi:hypothetical protein C3747_520g3 [Trypanosoma cruzi]|uniref:Uncharacterized protein n=1 Tax=Trypanosoma cruzi TaxID=5693 RepID=A0A2V2UV80_TRYCR|nr:hypothetical protein C3747_520g3 [Trypanosoma cruzi]